MKSYIHNIPGRLRVRSERFKTHPDENKGLQKALRFISGVTFVEYHPVSSSLLLRYDPASDAGSRVLELLRERGYLEEAEIKPKNQLAVVEKPKFEDRLMREVKTVAAATVATYLLEVLIIRFAPPALLLLLPFARKGRA